MHLLTLRSPLVLPTVDLKVFDSLVDDVGILQHGWHGVPRRSEGYCVDDNARLLLFCSREMTSQPKSKTSRKGSPSEHRQLTILSKRALAFLAHAWNDDTARFRNFMGYDRRWLDEAGSEDSNGRAMWCLGESTSVLPPDSSYLAEELLKLGADVLSEFESTRALSYATLGLCRSSLWHTHPSIREAAIQVGEKLQKRFSACADEDWCWFEDVVSYANFRVPEACIELGSRTDNAKLLDIGKRTLDWLNKQQYREDGTFTPIGCERVWKRGEQMPLFDQQPVEAAGSADCNTLAHSVFRDRDYYYLAQHAWTWFVGNNLTKMQVFFPTNGICFDGITKEGTNKNQGAESLLSALSALQRMHSESNANRLFEPK